MNIKDLFKSIYLNLFIIILGCLWLLTGFFNDFKLYNIITNKLVNGAFFVIGILMKYTVPWNSTANEITDNVWGNFVLIDGLVSITFFFITGRCILWFCDKVGIRNKILQFALCVGLPLLIIIIQINLIYRPGLAL